MEALYSLVPPPPIGGGPIGGGPVLLFPLEKDRDPCLFREFGGGSRSMSIAKTKRSQF